MTDETGHGTQDDEGDSTPVSIPDVHKDDLLIEMFAASVEIPADKIDEGTAALAALLQGWVADVRGTPLPDMSHLLHDPALQRMGFHIEHEPTMRQLDSDPYGTETTGAQRLLDEVRADQSKRRRRREYIRQILLGVLSGIVGYVASAAIAKRRG